MTADRQKGERVSNRDDVRQPSSVSSPSAGFTEQKHVLHRPVDIRRTEETRTLYAAQNGYKATLTDNRPINAPASATTAGSQVAEKQIMWNQPVTSSRDRLSQVVDKPRALPGAHTHQEAMERNPSVTEENEKRLREKEQQLRILEVIFYL